MRTVFKIIFLFFVLNSINCFSQSKIDRSKKDLDGGTKTENITNDPKMDSYSSKSSSNVRLDNEFRNILYEGFMYLTYYSIIGNYAIENHLHNRLTDYPYSSNFSGNFENSSTTTNYLRVDLEDQILLSHNNIYGNHLKAKIRPYQYFYIQTDLYTLVEYNKADKNYNNLSLLNINLSYDRIRFDRFKLGWSLGVNYIGNEIKKAGFECRCFYFQTLQSI